MGREPGPTATSALAQGLVFYAASRGVAPPVVIAHFGLDPAVLADVDGRVPLRTIARMWDELPVLCGDPDMPLHLADLALATDADTTLVTLLCGASATVGEALQRFRRFEKVHHGESMTALEVEGDALLLVVNPAQATVPLPPATVAFGFLWMLRLIAEATGRAIPVLGVSLRHPEPRDRAPYDARFGARVAFGAAVDRLCMPREILDWPQTSASARIARLAEAHALALEARLPAVPSWLDRVRESIARLLPDSGATLERVAREVDIAPRTLQRRLEAEGTGLRQVIDDVRRGLALDYVEQPATSLAEIAFLLGFSEQSAFHRAFVRWTGRTPGDHRRSLCARGVGGR